METLPSPEIYLPLSPKERLRKEQEVLETLSGFQALSKKQKQYIRASLYIQERAERGSDEVSVSRIQEMPEEFKMHSPGRSTINPSRLAISNPANGSDYFQSQLYIMSEYCHKAAATLESYKDGPELPDKFIEVGHIDSWEELVEFISLVESENSGPLVIDISSIHTTVLLGKDASGQYIVWEKSGYNMPFQIVPLKQVYQAYQSSKTWGIRPLSV